MDARARVPLCSLAHVAARLPPQPLPHTLKQQSLVARVGADMKAAMKAKDAPRLSAIRFLSAALKQREIELRASGGALSDGEAVATIQKLAKQRRDSIESYRQGATARAAAARFLPCCRDMPGGFANALRPRFKRGARAAVAAAAVVDDHGLGAHLASSLPLSLLKQSKQPPGGRDDLVAKEEAELALLEAYLPAPLTPAELEAIVKEAVAAVGATSPKQMGAVMKAVQAKAGGRADNKAVSALVKAALGG